MTVGFRANDGGNPGALVAIPAPIAGRRGRKTAQDVFTCYADSLSPEPLKSR